MHNVCFGEFLFGFIFLVKIKGFLIKKYGILTLIMNKYGFDHHIMFFQKKNIKTFYNKTGMVRIHQQPDINSL